jgi:hypothetical protein
MAYLRADRSAKFQSHTAKRSLAQRHCIPSPQFGIQIHPGRTLRNVHLRDRGGRHGSRAARAAMYAVYRYYNTRVNVVRG